MTKFPFTQTTLANGLRVITAEMPYMESVAIGILAGIGGRYEPDNLLGISHFLEHACFKGTEKRNARQISQAIEGIGGLINGFTSEENTCYYAKVRFSKFENAFDVLADMYLNPTFDKNELERERGVIIEEIKMYKDMPSQLVFDDFNATIWKNHPLGRPILGTFDSIKKISKKQLDSFRKKCYTPDNTVISVAGNISHNLVLDFAKKYFGKKKSSTEKLNLSPFVFNQKSPRIHIRNSNTEQAYLVAGFHAFGKSHPDRFVLRVLSNILGGNMSSRLNHEIREKRGLAYSVHSHVSKFLDTGALIISVDTDVAKLSNALSLTLKLCANIAEKGVKPIELKRAKEYINGITALAMEQTNSYMMWLGTNCFAGINFLNLDQTMEKINQVSIDDIKRVAKLIFKKNKLNIAVIADNIDKNKIKSIAKNW